jgi:hypothetical protein
MERADSIRHTHPARRGRASRRPEERRMTKSKIARQGLFALATTFALGFGAMEALAEPVAKSGTGAYCTAIWASKCNQICTDRGFDYGVCEEPGRCVCGNYPVE